MAKTKGGQSIEHLSWILSNSTTSFLERRPQMETRPDRIHIAYTIVFETPFHCGTGIREQLLDRTIVRDSRGYLYVPGTTFKGVLREHCEQLARLYEIDASMGKLIASPHDKEAALLGLGQKT